MIANVKKVKTVEYSQAEFNLGDVFPVQIEKIVEANKTIYSVALIKPGENAKIDEFICDQCEKYLIKNPI